MSKPIDTLTELSLQKLFLTFVSVNPDSQVAITLFASHSKLLHSSIRVLRFSVEAHPSCSAVHCTNSPGDFFQNNHALLSNLSIPGLVALMLPSSDCGIEVSNLLPTLRDRRALNRLFEFANVSRPASAHRLRITATSFQDKFHLALATVRVGVKAFDIRLFSQLGMGLIDCVISIASTRIGSGEIFGTRLALPQLGVAGAQ